jgi:hypothetical protein
VDQLVVGGVARREHHRVHLRDTGPDPLGKEQPVNLVTVLEVVGLIVLLLLVIALLLYIIRR